MSEEENGPLEPEEDLETPRPRRRVRLSYRSAQRSMMTDQVLILMALIVAAFMVYSRGCQTSFDGLARLLNEEVPENPDAGAAEPVQQ